MATSSQRNELIVFQYATITENEYNEKVQSWAEYVQRQARIRFGNAQEQREAAQENASQTATFECVRSLALEAVTLNDHRIFYDGSAWDLTEKAKLDRKTIRFTATRVL